MGWTTKADIIHTGAKYDSSCRCLSAKIEEQFKKAWDGAILDIIIDNLSKTQTGDLSPV